MEDSNAASGAKIRVRCGAIDTIANTRKFTDRNQTIFRPNMIHFFKSHVLKLALRLFEKDISMVLRQRIKRLLMEKRARGILIFCSEEPVKEFEKILCSTQRSMVSFSFSLPNIDSLL
ncbi:hypothetical protein V9T40_004234 [Parthenolecanium corni]|uniref:Uncharacterized protein n=1 Tax=Parthenolecanium corni TaxID=536013 RepID=A0AAN9TW10_9HEMI